LDLSKRNIEGSVLLRPEWTLSEDEVEIEGSVDEGPSESEVLVEAEGNGAVFLLSSI